MRLCLAIAVVLALGLREAAAARVERLKPSIVKIYATIQREGFAMPWQAQPPGSGSGSGFLIGRRRILTNAHVVSDARFIEVQKEGDDRKYAARVLFAGHDCDLALLTVDEDAFFAGLRPLPLARELPRLNDEVLAMGYPLGGTRISITRGVVSRIDYSLYSHSGVDSHLVLQIDAAINPGNSGGPVLYRGRVVGLAFQGITSAQNIGYAIPLPVIEHFLEDIEDDFYHGYPELGVWHLNARNPALRQSLGLPDQVGGIIVNALDPFGSAMGFLRPGDVLLALDGYPIATDGSVLLNGNVVLFHELLERKQWGDTARFHVWRAGQTMEVEVPLRNPPDPFAFRYPYDTPPAYFVAAGLVFTPLSRGFLSELGEELHQRNAQHLHYYAQFAKTDGLYSNRQEFVVLSAMLPHPINTYCGAYVHHILNAINGRTIGSLNDVQQAFASPTGGFHVIRFEGLDDPLVLDATRVPAADREIMNAYRLPALSRLRPEPPPR